MRRSASELLRELTDLLPKIPLEGLPGLLAGLESVRASGWLRLRLPVPTPGTAGSPTVKDHEELIDAPQTAKRLGVTLDWVRRHTDELPFTVRLGRRVRFSVAGLDRYVRSREGR